MSKETVYRDRIKKSPNLTLFQKKVLLAVLEVPRGKTCSYRDIAERIGSPASSRAVGAALKINPYAPSVPCHRVIASDGSLGGYSGGLTKKRSLLKKEGIKCGW